MSYVLKPNFTLAIGAVTITNDEATSITVEQGLSDQTGSFTLTMANPYGDRTASFTPYAECVVSVWYDGESAVELLGGNVETISYSRPEGDVIQLSGRDFSHKFTFKKLKKTYQYEAVSTIITDIVAEVNDNVADNFSVVGLPTAQANDNPAFGSSDPYNVSAPIFDLYDDDNCVGQLFTPNVPFIGAVTVRGNYVGNPTGSLECRLYEYDTNYATTIADPTKLRGLGTASWDVDKMSEQFSASKLPTAALLAAATDDTIDKASQASGAGNAGIVFYARGFTKGVWLYVKKTGSPDQAIKVGVYKCNTEDRQTLSWTTTRSGTEIASATVAAANIGAAYSFVKFDLQKAGLEMNGMYMLLVSTVANLTTGSYSIARAAHSISPPTLRSRNKTAQMDDDWYWQFDGVTGATVATSGGSWKVQFEFSTYGEPDVYWDGTLWVWFVVKDANGVALSATETTYLYEDITDGHEYSYSMTGNFGAMAAGTMTMTVGATTINRWEGRNPFYADYQTYEFRIGAGTMAVLGGETACFDEGTKYWNNAYYFAVGESIMPEINIVLNAGGIDTSKQHLLLFACDTLGDVSNHYRLLVDPDKHYNTTYYELKTAVTTADLWFKINSFQVSYEDKDAFEAMTNICSKIHHDWHVDPDKVVSIVSKGTGASQATFTVGDANVLDFNFTRDITRMKNSVTYAGRETDIYEPYDRDKWSDINVNRSGSWEVWTSDTSSISVYLDTYGVMIGKYTLRLHRPTTTNAGTVYFPGNGTTGSGTFPTDLITNKYTCMAFYCVGVAADEKPKVFRVVVNFNLAGGGTISLYKHVWIESVSSGLDQDSIMSNWQYLTIQLPQPNNPNGWSITATSEDRGASTSYDWTSINYMGIYLYASSALSSSTLTQLHIDGFHFEGTGDHRVVFEDADSKTAYDTREHMVRDKNMDTTSDTTSAAMAAIRRFGDGSNDYTGTPGDSKDVQQQATLTVIGRNDITPGGWITCVYAAANINQLYRVVRVSHNISKDMGWTTTYTLDNINKVINIEDIISGIKNSADNATCAGKVDNSRYSNNISSSNAANIMK